MKKPIKIPTIVALLFVGVIVASMAFITNSLSKRTEADVGKMPKDIQITNITDTSFTVIWQTEKPTRGVIQVKELQGINPSLTFYDDHAVQTASQELLTHSVTARGMKPQTTYSITFLNTNLEDLTLTTGPTLALNSNQLKPLYGTIKGPNGQSAENALVVITLPGSQTLSTTVKGSGSFLIPLNLVRTNDNTSYLAIDEQPVTIDITVLLGSQKTKAMTTTQYASPIPEMILGQSYDFTNQQSTTNSMTPTPDLTSLNSSFSTVLGTINNSSSSSSVSLQTPAKGAIIRSEYPFITGKGIADQIVTIVLGNNNPTVQTTRVNKDGTWQFTPKKPVGIGNQSVTITSFDENKKPISITHLFQIMKSGTQVLGDATPSASPTIFTPTPISSISATPIPTITLEPTPTEEIPQTATTIPTYLLLGIGILLTLGGMFTFLL